MADGRHDGLLDLPGNSPDALAEWFRSRLGGGHPWEIARGGSTTHISLYLSKVDEGYRLILEGSARTRAAETIRMALALTLEGIPLQVVDAVHLARMAQGLDWIGIVPNDHAPTYSQHLFPKEHEVKDILNYSAIASHPEAERRVRWYPVEQLHRVAPET